MAFCTQLSIFLDLILQIYAKQKQHVYMYGKRKESMHATFFKCPRGNFVLTNAEIYAQAIMHTL